MNVQGRLNFIGAMIGVGVNQWLDFFGYRLNMEWDETILTMLCMLCSFTLIWFLYGVLGVREKLSCRAARNILSLLLISLIFTLCYRLYQLAELVNYLGDDVVIGGIIIGIFLIPFIPLWFMPISLADLRETYPQKERK